MVSVKTKRKPLVAVLLAAALLLVASLASLVWAVGYRSRAVAADGENVGRTYYYDELKNSELARRFYGVMREMQEQGKLDGGTYEYDLSKILTEKEIADYVNGSAKVPVAFGAARDAFYMDNPDLFYIDVYKLYLSAGLQEGKYVAFVGTGNADNYYADYTVNSATEVATVKAKYETEIAKAVAAAKADGADIVTQIKNANRYIAEKTEYDYGAYQSSVNGEVVYNGYVNTAYGALVEGKAMCGGYARAFKAVMDRLGIPCALVQGYAYSGNGIVPEGGDSPLEAGFVSHMWNAVEVDGHWYAVDVTYNDGASNLDKYTLVGDQYFSINHISDGVISSSGFELKYPVLRALDYGVNTDKGGFTFKDSGKVDGKQFGYTASEYDSDNYALTLGVSYDGKNSKQLAEDGKYFAFRMGDSEVWIGFEAYADYMSANVDMSVSYIGEYTKFDMNWSVTNIQCAVFDIEPDLAITDQFGTTAVIGYSEESLTTGHIVAVSAVYSNKAYGAYMPAPYVKKLTPDYKGLIQNFEPMQVTIEYSEKLEYIDADEPVGVVIKGKSPDLGDYAKATDVVWDETTNTLSFTLVPSKQYKHFSERYDITPTNLVGAKSKKAPEPANYSFKMKQVICPKVFNDGRLYMSVFGRPQFVSASDESLNQFAGPDGKPLVGDQRSQLMLVVNEPTKAESNAMHDALLDPENDTGLTEANDIKASSTYEIDLLMCGLVQKVPDGSFMQVGFGFPEGFGPGDDGVTFTVYHYTRNPDGTVKDVQAVPCVVTEYGIIATVKSFSPFMICAVNSAKVAQPKSLYVTVNGKGGKVNDSEIRIFEDNDEFTYTFTPDDGYAVQSVLLNGTAQQLTDNTLTVSAAALDGDKSGNVLEVTFVSERVAADRTAKKLQIIQPKIVVTQNDMIIAKAHVVKTSPTDEGGAGVVVAVVIVTVLVLIGGGLALFLILRKKKEAAATAGGAQTKPQQQSNPSQQRKTEKPAAQAKPAQPRTTVNRASSQKPEQNARPTSQTRTGTRTSRPTDDKKKR